MASIAFEASLMRPGSLSNKVKPASKGGLELRKSRNQLRVQESPAQLDNRSRRHGTGSVSAVLDPVTAKPRMGLPPSEMEAMAMKNATQRSGGPKEVVSGTVKDALRSAVSAVGNARVETVGTVALYTGVAAMGTLLASHLVGSIDSLPLVPGFMQVAGMTYCTTVAVRFIAGGDSKALHLEPESPLRAAIALVDASPAGGDRFVRDDVELPSNLDPNVQSKMQQLLNQRNAAVKQAREIRAASSDLSRLLAEKEALESVALQLAQERDSAMSELNMLKNSVEAMTERMRGIDEMLALEVRRLQEQNNALESVAFALASERDHAIKEVDDLKLTVEASEEEKKALEILAAELIQERDDALAEVEEYKKIVATLSEATGSASGLTSQQETFLKNRFRVVKGQFVDITRPYEQQVDKVDLLVAHMTEEYGAPRDWTLNYVRQFLRASANGHATGQMKAASPVERTSGRFHF